MDNTQLLQTLGLTDKEAQIYNLLLELGKVQVSTLIVKTELKRATVYKSLYSLEAKGLVKQEDIRKKLHFSPQPPDSLLKLSDQQFDIQQRARTDLHSLLPKLNSSYILSVEKPVITVFEGVKGIKAIYEDKLTENNVIYAALQPSDVDPEVFRWLEEEHVKERIKKKIHANVIVSSGSWSGEYVNRRKQDEYTSTVQVDSTLFPIAHEVDIYGDKIAFINYRKGEALIGILIRHPLIAQTMRAMYELAWFGAAGEFPPVRSEKSATINIRTPKVSKATEMRSTTV